MKKPLLGEKIAVLVANGFSEKDLTLTQRALVSVGAHIRIVSMEQGLVNSWNDSGWGLNFAADQVLSSALAADFDMLIVPGGARSAEKLKLTAHTRRFIGGFVDAGKPVAFFEDAVSLLMFAGRASGYTLTGPESLQVEAETQGAVWCTDTFVESRNVMSGRSDEKGSEEVSVAVTRFLVESAEKAKNTVQQAA